MRPTAALGLTLVAQLAFAWSREHPRERHVHSQMVVGRPRSSHPPTWRICAVPPKTTAPSPSRSATRCKPPRHLPRRHQPLLSRPIELSSPSAAFRFRCHRKPKLLQRSRLHPSIQNPPLRCRPSSITRKYTPPRPTSSPDAPEASTFPAQLRAFITLHWPSSHLLTRLQPLAAER